MADRYLIASGNSTDPAIFDGGTFPAAVDTLRTNGFTLTVDADFTVGEIRNGTGGGATSALGQVILNGGVTLNADTRVVAAVGAKFLTAEFGGATSTINGNGMASHGAANAALLEVRGSAGGRLILNGNWGIDSLSNTGVRSIQLFGNGQGFIVDCNGQISGNITSSGSNNFWQDTHAMRCNSGYVINFNGVVTGRNDNSSGTNNSKGFLATGSNNIINVYGIALGGVNSAANSNSQAIDAGNNTNVVNLYGNAVGTLRNRAIVNGTVVFQSGANIIDHPENVAVSGIRERLVPFASVIREMVDVNGIDTVNMYTASLLTGYPTEADVRSGEVFGPVGEFTGTYPGINEFTDTVLAAIASIKAVP